MRLFVLASIAVFLSAYASDYDCMMSVDFRGDEYLEEIDFEITDSSGNSVYGSSGLCGVSTEFIELDDGETYTFRIEDDFGDGICCDYGDGYLKIAIDDVEIVNVGRYGEYSTGSFTCESSEPISIDQDINYESFIMCAQPQTGEGFCEISVETSFQRDLDMEMFEMLWVLTESEGYAEARDVSLFNFAFSYSHLAWNWDPLSTNFSCSMTEDVFYTLDFISFNEGVLLSEDDTLTIKINGEVVKTLSNVTAADIVFHDISCNTTSIQSEDVDFLQAHVAPSGEEGDYCTFTEPLIDEPSCSVSVVLSTSTSEDDWEGEWHIYYNGEDYLFSQVTTPEVMCYVPYSLFNTYTLHVESDGNNMLPPGNFLSLVVNGELVMNFTNVDDDADVDFTCNADGVVVGDFDQHSIVEDDHHAEEPETHVRPDVPSFCNVSGDAGDGYCTVTIDLSTSTSDSNWNSSWAVFQNGLDSPVMYSYLTNASTTCSIKAGERHRFELASETDYPSAYMEQDDILHLSVNGTRRANFTHEFPRAMDGLSSVWFTCDTFEDIYAERKSTCAFPNPEEQSCAVSVVTDFHRRPDEWDIYWHVDDYNEPLMYNEDFEVKNQTCYIPRVGRFPFQIYSYADQILTENETISLFIDGVERYVFTNLSETADVVFSCDSPSLTEDQVLTEYKESYYCQGNATQEGYCEVSVEMFSASPDDWSLEVTVENNDFSFPDLFIPDFRNKSTCGYYDGTGTITIDSTKNSFPILSGNDSIVFYVNGKEVYTFSQLIDTTTATFDCTTKSIDSDRVEIDYPTYWRYDDSWCYTEEKGDDFCDIKVEISRSRVIEGWYTQWTLAEDTYDNLASFSYSGQEHPVTCSMEKGRDYKFRLVSDDEDVPVLFGDESVTVTVDGIEVYTFSDILGEASAVLTCGMTAINDSHVNFEDNDYLEEKIEERCGYHECRMEGGSLRVCDPEAFECRLDVVFSGVSDAHFFWSASEFNSSDILASASTADDLQHRETLDTELVYVLRLISNGTESITGDVEITAGDDMEYYVDLATIPAWTEIMVEFTCAEILEFEMTEYVAPTDPDSSSSIPDSSSDVGSNSTSTDGASPAKVTFAVMLAIVAVVSFVA